MSKIVLLMLAVVLVRPVRKIQPVRKTAAPTAGEKSG